jgi:MmyB-like transcription regulator ligand binding domain
MPLRPRADRPRGRAVHAQRRVQPALGKHDVRCHISGVKRYRHSQVGELELNYERLDVVFDAGLTDPGTRSAEALSLLGTPAATTAGERTPTRVLNRRGRGLGMSWSW